MSVGSTELISERRRRLCRRRERVTEWDDFSIGRAGPEEPPTQHLHLAFAAQGRDEVDAFRRRGVDAGYRSDGEPELRPQYAEGHDGAFLLDPDGTNAEAVSRNR